MLMWEVSFWWVPVVVVFALLTSGALDAIEKMLGGHSSEPTMGERRLARFKERMRRRRRAERGRQSREALAQLRALRKAERDGGAR